jgi:hypothetical protein
MTVQIFDNIFYKNKKYFISGVNEELFHPGNYGIEPVWFSTNCWRGYFCEYKIRNNQLLLSKLGIGFENEESINAGKETAPILFNKSPLWEDDENCFIYKKLDEPISYTGGVLFGSEFHIRHAFHPALKFTHLYEAGFQKGKTTFVEDKTEEIRSVQEKLISDGIDIEFENRLVIGELLDSCFKHKFSQEIYL